MCNYKGLQDVLLHSGSSISDRGAKKLLKSGGRKVAEQQKGNGKEMWLRAAVIAVCIAGAFILVLLVMLALRMLRSENQRLQRQHQQMISRLHYTFQEPPADKVLVGNLDFEATAAIARDHETCCTLHSQPHHLHPYAETFGSFFPWDLYSGYKKPTLV